MVCHLVYWLDELPNGLRKAIAAISIWFLEAVHVIVGRLSLLVD